MYSTFVIICKPLQLMHREKGRGRGGDRKKKWGEGEGQRKKRGRVERWGNRGVEGENERERERERERESGRKKEKDGMAKCRRYGEAVRMNTDCIIEFLYTYMYMNIIIEAPRLSLYTMP